MTPHEMDAFGASPSPWGRYPEAVDEDPGQFRRIVLTMRIPELSGVTIVGAGSFNPAIFDPFWLSGKGLIAENLAEHAAEQTPNQQLIVSPELTVFVADWLSVQVTQQQAVFSTVDMGRELDLRDLVKSVFELLPETPVDAVGINSDSHFRTESEEAWHAFGDLFLPKDFWEPIFDSEMWKARADGKRVGMRVMRVETHRDDPELPGFVRVEVAPSIRITPNGVFVGINGHFQLSQGGSRENAGAAADVLMKQWDQTRELENKLIAALLEAI